MASPQDQVQIQLCETCRSIAFDVLVYGVYGTPALVPYQLQGNNQSAPVAQLGSLDGILQRAPTCFFCTLVSQAAVEQQPAKHFSDLQKIVCAIEREEFWYVSERTIDDKDMSLDPSKNKAMYRLVVSAGLPPVARKEEGNDGDRQFLYLHPCAHPVSSVEKACGHDDLLGAPVLGSGRFMDPLIDVRLLRRWLDRCETLHGKACASPSWSNAADKQPAGFRVIDVPQRCIVDAPEDCRYVALSYMWGAPGPAGHFQATTVNMDQLGTPGSLALETLPQTIGDAMRLVYDLGEKYLWVDAICILQDVDKDKALFIPVMDKIFSLAVLTIISASGDSSRAGIAGLYSAPRQVSQRVVRVTNKLTLMETFNTATTFSKYQWNTRGWTFQERLCSRRMLIFTDDQVYWNCGEADWCERIALEFGPPRETIVKWRLGCYSDTDRDDFNDNVYELLDVRYLDYLINQYSNRNLTNQSDAFDAITGLLRRVMSVSGVRFCWGLPEPRFGEILASWWTAGSREEVRRINACRVYCEDGSIHQVPFPSWSWLGWRGEVDVNIPKPLGSLQSELEFYRVDIDGRLMKIDEGGGREKNWKLKPTIDKKLRSCWKGPTTLKADNFQGGRCFRDSGLLRFWTSHALLRLTRFDGDSRCCFFDAKGEETGYVYSELISTQEDEFHSFIVLSRYYTYAGDSEVRPHRRLNVMLVRWDDQSSGLASRVTVGVIDELAWVEAEPQWTLVTLQ